ncbi:efflux RND transporter periplasmic adaptor subunit [Rhodopirellula europaea]|uniref:Secretion protein HlyD n=1 Tax=Rhodopirellula europaea 6C TaxID=1263867 RepID=M2AGU5_9BACT|nr:Secretion protein HlyD [Rhodopirellula europaea 6C]
MSNHNHQNKKTTAAEDAETRSEPVAQSTSEASVPENKEASSMNKNHQPSTNEEQDVSAETKSSDATPDTASQPDSPTKVSTPDTPASTAALAETKVGGFGWLLRVGVNAAVVTAVAALILVMIGFAQRSEWVTANGFSGGESEAVADASGGEEKRYICPMMCTPPSTEPGRCPVCAMELVEATGGGGGDGISVTIESAARRLVGIQTATSRFGEVTRTIRTIGSIDFDESRLSTISAYIDGRLEELYADYVGVEVTEGDDLALIYSPKLYSAQTEYIASMESKSVGRFSINSSDLREMARENLSELGMTDSQIAALKKSGKPNSRIRIKSPQTGTVLEKAAVEGDYVKTGQKIYRIADLTSVWLMLDLFPDDAASVRFGQQVEAEIQSMPGEVFTGRVAFIDPTVNPTTRTVRVRVEVMNYDGKLRPGDYATARITVPAISTDFVYDPALSGKYISPMHPQVIREEPGMCPLCGMDLVPTSQLGYATEPQPQQRVVTVPRDAVLLTGENGVVYVETEPGRFEIRRVTVGQMNDTEAIIVEGMVAGETVATNGNFLIDSQMQLAGNPSLMDPSKAPSYSPGPLQLPETTPVMLAGQSAAQFDRAYDAYFEIQCAMSADTTPPPVALNTLLDALARLEMLSEVPDEAQSRFASARRGASRMDGSLETAREAYRSVSHALLKAATIARGPKTARSLVHMYCPMVPGGGGDWMQPGGELQNPYWGSEMLTCGETVRDLAMNAANGDGQEVSFKVVGFGTDTGEMQ